jgi:lipopolysaccharide transport system ATP-binding protein
MNATVIHVEGLGKRYRVSERERYFALRDVLARVLTAPFRRGQRSATDYLWALRDVSLDVQQGEVVGLIGRNGAGKTTLLKLLSRITRPTSGFAEIHGRVGSLLEVGTGFHSELTGRENIYLSGAILGMSKREIDQKHDAIVAFAEVERFLDTPLKHYSTGMQMRLAFAVAAHLEPEILLVDEVLAVGDLAFQKKCMGKMQDISESGRTIVFVSHQMNQIRRLCQRVFWLEDGQIYKTGPASQTVAAYEAETTSGSAVLAAGRVPGNSKARFLGWAIEDSSSGLPNVLASTGPVRLTFELALQKPIRAGHHGIALYNQEQQLIWGTDVENLALSPGSYSLVHCLPSLPLRPGPYTWRVSLYEEFERLDDWQCIPEMLVTTPPVTHSKDEWAGILNIPEEFTVIRNQTENNEFAATI